MSVVEISRQPGDRPPLRVLLIDDDPEQHARVLEVLAPPRYQVTSVQGGSMGVERLPPDEFDVILLGAIPGMTCDDVCRRIRDDVQLALLPIVVMTGCADADGLRESLAAGADDFIRKPYLPIDMTTRIDSAVQRKRTTDQLDNAESLLFALARMVEAKDANTSDHCCRLSNTCVHLGQALGLGEPALAALRRGGVLHDIGKLCIPDAILMKPTALLAHEWMIMRQHPVLGAELVGGLKSMRLTVPIIRHHHERWDGTGYPDGLAGEAIPFLARVFQIVDIYDALAFSRPYKAAMGRDLALEILADEAARGWRDPAITKVFIDLVRAHPDRLEVNAAPSSDLGAELFRRVAGALAVGASA
jgi:putative two-component system response regulator